MLDTAIGPKSDPLVIDELLAQLARQPWSGTLYVGYPLVRSVQGLVAIDALLTCREHGVVVFDIVRGAGRADPRRVAARQADVRQTLLAALSRSARVVVGDRPIVDIHVVTVDPDHDVPLPPTVHEGMLGAPTPDAGHPGTATRAAPGRYSLRPPRPAPSPAVDSARGDGREYRRGTPGGAAAEAFPPGAVTALTQVLARVERCPSIDAAALRVVDQAVQRLGAVRPAAPAGSIGALAGWRAAVLAEIDREITTMDRWQKIAAIETPDGPQRIRGLAGSGKTVVLAHKAAYLHAREPSWRIALTFYARTLYEPLLALVRRFYVELTRQEPNWELLHVRHAWGATEMPGICRDIGGHVGISTSGYAAEQRYGKAGMFAGVCGEVLAAMGPSDPEPLYDVVLIDEAQDLPQAFFEMVYRVTRPPKRVVWAYDELQNLSEFETASPKTLFGRDASGRVRVPDLPRIDGEAQQDVILPICYRNTTWALTTAHALGLGVYRRPPTGARTGLVQFYEDPKLWQDIGYDVVSGEVAPGAPVVLARRRGGSPAYFNRLLKSDDAVRCVECGSSDEEAAWVAAEIARNIEDEGLAARDILIVSANPYFKAGHALPFIRALQRHGIRSHVAGTGERRNVLFGQDPSVAISVITRAKGGEAPMVYVVQAEHSAPDGERMPIKRRNALFSAITRSRAWVRISGAGPGMQAVRREVAQVKANGFQLRVVVPTAAELKQMRRLPRDMTERQRRALVRKGRAGALALMDLLRADPSLIDEAMRQLPAGDVASLRAALRALNGDTESA